MTAGHAAQAGGQALQDLTVVCLAALGPVPYAAMLLSDLGARVIRVDRPQQPTGVTGLSHEDDPRTRGHESIGLDLRDERGRDLLLRLVGSADVLLEGMRPGAAERLRIGPEDLQAINPGLVYGRATGWGQTGTRALTAGHDINYAAIAGGLYPIGPADSPPVPPLNMLADFGGGGMFLALGVLAAVHQRSMTGRGQVVDAAMVDGVASLTTMMHGMLSAGLWSNARGDNVLDGAAPYYRTYATSDGGFIAVGAIESQFYAEFLSVLDLPASEWPQNDRTQWTDQISRLTEIFASRDRAHWEAAFEGRDACVSAVYSLGEAAVVEELRERGTFVEWDGVVQPAPAPRLSDSAVIQKPRVGWCHNTDELLAEAGLTASEIDELKKAGVVR